MTRTFADDLADDVANAFTDTTEFGEAVTYQPVDGPERSINALVLENTTHQANQVGLIRGDLLRVLVRRHATAGIDNPRIGDGLRLAGDPVAYAFNGTIEGKSSAAWTLTFTRETPEQYGGTHQEPIQ